jgi:hypothetical protein
MGLQEEVNTQVAAIRAAIDEAATAAAAVPGLIAAIDDTQGIDHGPIVDAFNAVAEAINVIRDGFIAVADAVDDIELTPGPKGDAATIAIGEVTTLSPGSEATVVNAGTESEAVFDFGIPRGADGTDGDDGEDGAAATIAVGSVNTLAAGSSATFENVGTPTEAIFNVGIPRGADGEDGSTPSDVLFWFSGDDDPEDLVFIPESPPTEGLVYIWNGVGAYIYIASLTPHWRQFAS